MPRPKEYESNAARQAAYRARHAHQQPPKETLLAALTRTLHSTQYHSRRGGPRERVGRRRIGSTERRNFAQAHYSLQKWRKIKMELRRERLCGSAEV